MQTSCAEAAGQVLVAMSVEELKRIEDSGGNPCIAKSLGVFLSVCLYEIGDTCMR